MHKPSISSPKALNQLRFGLSEDFKVSKQRFLERLYQIEEHNASNATYKLGINQFAHLGPKGLSQLTGLIYIPKKETRKVYAAQPVQAAPATHDWTSTENVVRPVQSQGSCGSCWAFAAVGAIEGQMALKKQKFDKLSEQEVIECATSDGVLRGCNGGWDSLVYDHAKVNKGVTTLGNDPYVASTAGRKCDVTRPRAAGSTVASWTNVPQNEAAIKEALFANGPLYIIYHVSNDFYSYKSGIFTDVKNSCGTNGPNHAVLLVGYGTLNGVDYWLLKNSWGPTWGENGFFKLKRGSNLCQINVGASYPTLA